MDIWGLFSTALPFLLLAIGVWAWVWVASMSDEEYKKRPETKNYD